MSTRHSYLIDGPLMGLLDHRRALIGQMATDLLATRAYGSYADAQAALRSLGHDPWDINLLAEEAIEFARNEVNWRRETAFDTTLVQVAEAMAQP